MMSQNEKYGKDDKEFMAHWKVIKKEFDWDRLVDAMNAVEWFWSTAQGAKVPSKKELRGCARDLAYKAFKQPDTSYVTGGFYAMYSDGNLNLSFRMEDINTGF